MKYFKYIWLFVLAVATVSCDSFLDVDPVQEIDSSTALETGDNVELLLVSAYPRARDAYGKNIFHFSELLGNINEMGFQGTYSQPRDLMQKSLVADFSWGTNAWDRAYDAINRVNLVLANSSKVKDSRRAQVEGEALFLRGMLLFDLVRYYAKPYVAGQANNQDGVPIVLTPTTNSALVDYPSRSSVDQVYQQVISDLKSAKEKMMDSGEVFYANEFAAAAVLSRVYLQQGKFAEAAAEASFVIENGDYSLVADPFKAYNLESNGPEDVFAFQQNNDDNVGSANEGIATFYASTDATGRSDFYINESMLARYEEGDLRGKLQAGLGDGSKMGDVKSIYYMGFGPKASGGIFCAKWLDFKTNLTFIRLAEMYLTRAEGNFESNKSVGATPLDDINVIRVRAGLKPLTSLTRDQIRNERMLELAFEGFKLNDIKRWKKPVGELSYDAPALVLPIPKRERDVNKNLTQNEGY